MECFGKDKRAVKKLDTIYKLIFRFHSVAKKELNNF